MPLPAVVWPPDAPTAYGMVATVVLAGLTGALCRWLLARAAGRCRTTAAAQDGADTATPARGDTATPAGGDTATPAGADTDRATPERPPDYRRLGTPGFVVAVATSALLAGTAVIGWAPPAAWPSWWGVVSLGVLLGWIDAATTWLPSSLVHPLWVLTAVGTAGTGLLGWFEDPATWWVRPATATVGAVGYGLVFAIVWRIGHGGLGFGDVRLAVALGAATGACSPTIAVLGAVIGTSLGALWAIGRIARGRRESFPYGPFLLLGAVLAPLLASALAHGN